MKYFFRIYFLFFCWHSLLLLFSVHICKITNQYLFSLDLHKSFDDDENNLFSFFFNSFLEVTAFKRVSRVIIDENKNLTLFFIIAVAHDIVHKIIRFFTIILLFSIKCLQRFRRCSISTHDVAIMNHSF